MAMLPLRRTFQLLRTRVRLAATGLVAAATLAACGDAAAPSGAPAGLSATDQTAFSGTVFSPLPAPLRVRVQDARGRAVPDVVVAWTVTAGDGVIDAAAARTDRNGEAPATWTLGRVAGEQSVDARVGNLPPVRFVAMAEAGPVARIVLSADSVQFDAIADSARIDTRVEDAHGNVVGTAVTWSTADAGIVAVDGSGKLVAIGNGLTTLTVSTPALGRTIPVRVAQHAVSAAVQPATDTINALTFVRRLTLLVRDRNGVALTAPSVTWQSLDPALAAVDAAGNVRAIAPGTARILARSGSLSDTARVHVRQRVAAVTVTPTQQTLAPGTQLTIEASATDSAAVAIASAAFSWLSNDTTVAVVDTQGRITARHEGTAAISARSTADPSRYATAVITVHRNALTVSITPAVASIAAGDSLQLDAAVQGATNTAVSWRTSAPATATVSSSGMVRAHAAGTVVITAVAAADTLFRATATLQITPAAQVAACTGPGAVTLDLPLGGHIRRLASSNDAPQCLLFDGARAAGQQYLVLFENMPLTGGYTSGLFPGAPSASTFAVSLSTGISGATTAPALASAQVAAGTTARTWDFGAGPIHELEVTPPAQSADPMVLRADGRMLALQSMAAPVVGDTVVVYLEGIPRLGIAPGPQRAVIRHISSELIIAEDTRLQTSLRRQSGGLNQPLSAQTLQAIAGEYAAFANVQGNALFAGRHNADVESAAPQRVLAVHSLMAADNVWGYTYSTGNYFVWDYWVGTDGSIAGIAQLPQVVADNLFMHEIAHMRHWGMLERAGRTAIRGNRWLVEGFARFSERLPIAARLLGTQNPSRSGNVVLPLNPAFNGAYYRNDVPTYLNAGGDAFGGYDNASFFFDYIADHVAGAGRDHHAALRDIVTFAGTSSDSDAAVARWLPGLTLGDVMTRARIALYADDAAPLASVPWTQYLQYQLRASRPAGSAATFDPLNLWYRIVPGAAFSDARGITTGGAWGYLIDGASTSATAALRLDADRVPNGIISITRVR